jgi:hypothetical protein
VPYYKAGYEIAFGFSKSNLQLSSDLKTLSGPAVSESIVSNTLRAPSFLRLLQKGWETTSIN